MKMLKIVSALLLATVCSIANAGGMLSGDIMWGGDVIADNWGPNRTSLLETGQAVQGNTQGVSDNSQAIIDSNASSMSRHAAMGNRMTATESATYANTGMSQKNSQRIDFISQGVEQNRQAINQLNQRYRAGSASAMSVGMLPQPIRDGIMMAGSGATYGGEQSASIGLSGMKGNHVIKAGYVVDSFEQGGAIAYGYQF